MVLGTSPGSSGWVSEHRVGGTGRGRARAQQSPGESRVPPPGNEALHSLTSTGDYSMRVDLRAGAEAAFAQYDSFRVDSAADYYRLHLEGYHGTAGEAGPGLRQVRLGLGAWRCGEALTPHLAPPPPQGTP